MIAVANDTPYGLSSAVCTNRLDYITRFINELEVGTVNVWEVPGYRIEMSPFGGIKDFGPWLQGRRLGGHEKLHQRQDLFAALADISVASAAFTLGEYRFMFAKLFRVAAACALATAC